jgi:D-alanyl-lipoteichoic acid acyltransferase DltB (MBOAT superfamily)
MLFDTPVYFVFLILVVVGYWRLGHRGQNRFLFVASCFFYGWWDWRFLLLMLGSARVDFVLAQRIADSPNPRVKRSLLAFSLILNFSVLGFFKYFNFFAHSLINSLASLGVHSVSLPLLQILLPPGISFYTFQEVAYIVDVYRGQLQPSRRFTDYGLFICLFPHLIAGPIQRPSHLLPQVQQPRHWDAQKLFTGVMLILVGLFRKSVIADNAATVANAAFDGKIGHSFFATIIGVFAFALQIYGDFSGYSDIARGSAQLLGFHFRVNFRQPYLASSLQEFWRRWHISLSTWLRDYLYFSLGGNRQGILKTYRNLLATMLLGGLWHGANWTFVVWGALHGAWLSIERMFSRSKPDKGFRPVGWAVTMMVVGLSWLLFRAPSIAAALTMLGDLRLFDWRPAFLPMLAYLAVITLLLLALDLRLELRDEEYPFEKARPEFAIATATVCCVLIAVFGPMEKNGFIYFQF